MMKKMIAMALCLALVLSCAAGLAETAEKTNIGTVNINGTFEAHCTLPEGYTMETESEENGGLVSMITSSDPTKPVLILSIMFDEMYADVEKLNDLDARFTELTANAACKTVLFGDRFPFRYFVDDYGLSYYAAFKGCSAESEASFETVVFLAGKVDELGLPAVMTIENPKTRIAETIVQTTKARNQKILAMDSLQSVTSREVNAGVSYLNVMESNLEILKQALN